MDSSFTFLTAVAGDKRTNKPPRFTKLLTGKSKSINKRQVLISNTQEGSSKDSSSKENNGIETDNSSSIPGCFDYVYSSLYEKDRVNHQLEILGISNKSSLSIGSLKSRSDSIHFSSEQSLIDVIQIDSSPESSSTKKSIRDGIVDPICASLNKVTIRRKSRMPNFSKYYSEINDLDYKKVFSSTPSNRHESFTTGRSSGTNTIFNSTMNTTRTSYFSLNDNDRNIPDELENKTSDDSSSYITCADVDSDSSGTDSSKKVTSIYSSKKKLCSTGKKSDLSDSDFMECDEKNDSKSKKLKTFRRKKTTKPCTKLIITTVTTDKEEDEDWIDDDECVEAVTSDKVKKSCKNIKTIKKRFGKKKKDSFIVSDSSVENEDPLDYHKFITNNIKMNTKKLVSSSRKKITTHLEGDHGIFAISQKRLFFEDFDSKKTEESKNTPGRRKYVLLGDSDLSGDSYNNNSFTTAVISDTEKPVIDGSRYSDVGCNNNFSTPVNNCKPVNEKIIELLDSDNDTTTPVKKKTPKTNSDKKKASKGIAITPVVKKKINHLLLNSSVNTPNGNLKNQYHSFLRSLSNVTGPLEVHPDAVRFKNNFKKLKVELSKKLFTLFNKEVFQNEIPNDMPIEWNARMRTTSGYCYNKRVTKFVNGSKEISRVSRIVLSSKIVVTPERLRDTLIHELCHAASWLINGKSDGHGPIWKSWSTKAMLRYPELPMIKRCHDYAIKTKFTYRCVKCGYSIGRHSKSLNLQRKRCGYCMGEFELMLNISGKEGRLAVPHKMATKSKPISKFALFVKEHYSIVKKENPTLKHGEIMKLLGSKFSASKD